MALDRPLAITAGEPAGIGPELCNSLVDSKFVNDVVVIGDRRQLCTDLDVIDTPFPELVRPGQPSPANADALLRGLRTAVEGCLDGRFSGMVTAPLAKSVIAESGIEFTGHTEFIASITNTALPVMMLVAGDLRVALACTHMPLRDVADYLTPERLESWIARSPRSLV